VVHGHGPSHSSRQPKCDWLVFFVIIFMETVATHYCLESSGRAAYMETHPYFL
jgi:hypothetical protein